MAGKRKRPGRVRGTFTGMPKVAPFESCVACFKGDTQTAVQLVGEAEFIIAALEKLGIPEKQAVVLVQMGAQEDYGCDPGMVPTFDIELTFRVCSECAGKAGLQVARLPQAMGYYGERIGDREASDDA